MNENYAEKVILNIFMYIVRDNLLNNFVYDEETEDELQEEAKDFGLEDLNKSLNHYEISAGELRTLLDEVNQVFGIELEEVKYWENGANNCIVSRKDAQKNAFIGMEVIMDPDTNLRHNLTFREIAEDIINSVIAKLNQ